MSAPTWGQQLADWQTWLDAHLDDPGLIAGCHRVGRLLAGGGQ